MTGGSWSNLWATHAELATLIDQAKSSDLQRRFLGGLSPLQVPAIGFEVSKKGIRCRPQIAAMLITDRPKQFQAILQPWLPEESFADLAGWVRSREEFQPDTWIEWPKSLRTGARSEAFMLFRRPSQSWNLQALPKLLNELHAEMPPNVRSILPIPSEEWWTSLFSLPLGILDQLGLDFSGDRPSWRFLFDIRDREALFGKLRLSEPWQRCIEEHPLQFACSSHSDPVCSCGLEVLPLYRKTRTVTNYPGQVPAHADQWPVWPSHAALLPNKKLLAWMNTSVHLHRISVADIPVGVRGGLSHQKLVLDSGEVVDHKAYLGVVITRPLVSPADHAIDHLSRDKPAWNGFDLSIGSSDVWIPIACLTLVEPLRNHPRLSDAFDANEDAVIDCLSNPAPVGYNRKAPVDLDSTLWLMRYLDTCGRPASLSCERLISDAMGSYGSLTTYLEPQEISRFINLPEDQVLGWCAKHDCVTANLASSASLSGSSLALAYVRSKLQEGDFISYWWPLKTMVLSLLPRGSLPRRVVRGVLEEDYSDNIKSVVPEPIALRSRQFLDSLFMLRHGTVAEQDAGESKLHQLIQSPDDFKNLLLMQLPEPNIVDPGTQKRWTFNGLYEGSIVVDRYGFFAASMVLNVLVDVDRLRVDSYMTGSR